ncbi:MAG TPA: sialate O-acetylesterase, partial [Candidatus Limnocylindria bacterium]|nr:sialate O-acetylesterase [Candidatus Limnocylindria bacterium]
MTRSPRLTYSILCCAGVLWEGTASAADKPVSAQVHLSSPLEYQVFQRQSRTKGSIVIEGGVALQNVDAATGPVRLQFRLIGTGRDSKPFSSWQPLPFDSRVPRFRAEIVVPPGGWYRLETQVLAGPLPVSTNTIEHVGVGEVFVVAGQSNSANHGEGQQRPKSGLASSRGGNGWGVANDPQPGASGGGGSFIPALGDALAAHLGVPIGFICTGAGGTSVREWLPEGISFPTPPTTGQNAITLGPETWVSTGSLYGQLVDRSRAQGSHGFRAVLWHQGESDNNQPDGRNI